MTTPQRRIGMGFRHAVLLELGTDCMPAATGTAPYTGVIIHGAKTLEVNSPSWRQVVATGDDIIQALDVLPPSEPLTATLTTGMINDEVDAALSDAKSFNPGTDDYIRMMAIGVTDDDDLDTVAILAYQQAQSKAGSSCGSRYWEFVLFPSVRMARTQPGFSDDPSQVQYNVYPNLIDEHLWGKALASATEGVEDAQGFRGIMDGKPSLVAWLGNETDIQYSFPASAQAADTGYYVFIDGVEATSGDVTKATDTITLATTAITSGTSKIIAFYKGS